LQSERTLLEQIRQDRIWEFPGGIHPPEQKHLSNQSPIAEMPLAELYYISVKQHIGTVDDILVAIGDTVKLGQPLTAANLTMTVPIHAPVTGIVADITEHVSAHASGKPETTIIIKPEPQAQQDQISATPDSAPAPLANWQQADKVTLIEQIKSMGISGLGGAGFPTHIKMRPNKAIDLLILNGVECEPYITADDVLMRHHANEIVTGTQILQHVIGCPMVIIAIEDNKPEAISAMRQATAEHDNIVVRVVPTKYPSGGEKQLIQLLTNQQVPSGGIPADLGIVMQNVGTTFAVKQAVIDGLPLTRRVVTVTGESVIQAQNVWAPIGTPIKALLEFAGFKPERDQRLIMGGPMMGFAILDDLMPVVKMTNCILAPSARKLTPVGNEQPCIRCGQCADACPAELLPQQMLWYSQAKDHDKLKNYNLFDCIECGACAYVCPSQIPLVQYYRTSKAEIRETEQEKRLSDKARARFEARQERLEREKQARLEKHKAAADKRAAALEKDTSAKDKIAAALARAKAKKAEKAAQTNSESVADTVAADKTVANETAGDKQVPNNKDKVAAAIARAKAKKAQAQTGAEVTDDAVDAAADERKAKVAAAIAKAKAKKEQASSDESSTSEDKPLSAEDVRKQKVAAAIAKAKARKQSKGES
jgi:Na+-translocating ferredoxin:NAD+ oxidoreductase subunit C